MGVKEIIVNLQE